MWRSRKISLDLPQWSQQLHGPDLRLHCLLPGEFVRDVNRTMPALVRLKELHRHFESL